LIHSPRYRIGDYSCTSLNTRSNRRGAQAPPFACYILILMFGKASLDVWPRRTGMDVGTLV